MIPSELPHRGSGCLVLCYLLTHYGSVPELSTEIWGGGGAEGNLTTRPQQSPIQGKAEGRHRTSLHPPLPFCPGQRGIHFCLEGQ